MINDKLIEKIRKLLALAADQTNPHVSAEALRKAQEMMAEAGLTEEALERASIKKGSAKSPFSVSRLKLYEQILVNGIAKAFGCDWVFGMNHSRSVENEAVINFYGPHARLQLAIYAYEVLSRQLRKARGIYVQQQTDAFLAQAKERAFEQGLDETYAIELFGYSDVKAARRKKLKSLGDAFCLGFVTEIQKKVVALAVGDAEWALIQSVAKDDTTGEADVKNVSIDAAAFHSGVDAARDAHLHRPMEGGNEPVSLLGQTLQLESK